MGSYKRKYEMINHTADIAIKVYGMDYEDLFKNALSAWIHIVAEDIPSGGCEADLHLYADSPEDLLVSFLSEINFYFLGEKKFAVDISDMNITNRNGKFYLLAKILFVEAELSKISFRTEIKAVTYHRMEITEENGILSAIVIFDI